MTVAVQGSRKSEQEFFLSAFVTVEGKTLVVQQGMERVLGSH
jgi:hypothetical protein